MASKSGQQEPEKAEVIEELLDDLDTALDRVKVLYEQYFLGIQKQPPAYLHTDVERKIRDLTQLQIRNTALRYRFATLQQKYGSYNSYWRRTLRQIENGTYTRNLQKVGRQAARTGAAVPEEILAAMPKRMREQVIRDREAALALARLRERQAHDDEPRALADGDVEIDVTDLDSAAFIRESSEVRRNALTAAAVYRVDESDAELDVDGFFASAIQDDPPPHDALSRPASAEPVAPARPLARRPIKKRPPTDDGLPGPAASSSGPATRRITGATRTVRPPSSPGVERTVRPPSSPGIEPEAPGSARRLQIARPPSSDDTEPQLSIPPIDAASPGASTRKITGPMRTVRPPSNPDPEPASGPPSGEPGRTTGQTLTARPLPSHDTERRLSIPPIGAANPGAATRRITGQFRAVRAPTNPDAEPAVGPSIPPVAPPSPVAGPASPGAATRRITSPVRAARPPSNPDPEPPSAASPGRVTAEVAPEPAARPDPARTAPSQATQPLRVAPGSAAAHAAASVETLAGPFPRLPSSPPAIPAPPPLPDRAPGPPPGRPASEPASPEAASPVSTSASSPTPASPTTAGEGPAAPPSVSPRPAPPPLPSIRRTPPPVRMTPPPASPKHADPPRPGPGEPPPPEPRQAPPPGMTDADVHALYAKYVKAKQILGEEVEPGTYGKLLKTIHAQAPRIMEQYKAKGVDFSIVVKDNQVIIRAKPKP